MFSTVMRLRIKSQLMHTHCIQIWVFVGAFHSSGCKEDGGMGAEEKKMLAEICAYFPCKPSNPFARSALSPQSPLLCTAEHKHHLRITDTIRICASSIPYGRARFLHIKCAKLQRTRASVYSKHMREHTANNYKCINPSFAFRRRRQCA